MSLAGFQITIKRETQDPLCITVLPYSAPFQNLCSLWKSVYSQEGTTLASEQNEDNFELSVPTTTCHVGFLTPAKGITRSNNVPEDAGKVHAGNRKEYLDHGLSRSRHLSLGWRGGSVTWHSHHFRLERWFSLQVSRVVMLWFPAIAPLWPVPPSLHFLSENTPAASPTGAYMSSAGLSSMHTKNTRAWGLWDLCHPAADGDSSFDSCSLLDNSEMDMLCGIPWNTSSCREALKMFTKISIWWSNGLLNMENQSRWIWTCFYMRKERKFWTMRMRFTRHIRAKWFLSDIIVKSETWTSTSKSINPDM